MKTIYRIARLELSTLFYSPIAWLVLIVFTFQSGMDLADVFKRFLTYQESGDHLTNLTEFIYTGPYGFITGLQSNLYLYVPLLTMGLMSREISSGSIKLLLSSPIKIREIVLGKFAAMMAYCLLLMGVVLLFVLASMFSIEHLDVKLLVSGMLGLYLLVCAYSAIGLFMSCLTSYQVVAAISTLVVLAALNYLGNIGQHSAFIRGLTYCLSMAGRSDHFINGLISSRDFLYFVIVIGVFLGLPILKLRGQQESKSALVKTGRYLLLILTGVGAGFISSMPVLTGYLDMTATQARTLTKNSQEIVKKIPQPLTITAYTNLFDAYYFLGQPELRNQDVDFWEIYQRFMPNMKREYIYYYDTSFDNEWMYRNNKGLQGIELAKKLTDARSMDLTSFLAPAEIRKQIDLSGEENRFVRKVEAGGKSAFLRVFDYESNPQPKEKQITAALKRLITTPPKVAFLTGNYERSMDKKGDKDYKFATREVGFRHSMINQGFDVVQVNLQEEEIPAGLAALMIVDPAKPFQPQDQEKIKKYIAAGGNLLIAGEPGRQAFLNPLLAPLGVQLMDGLLIRESKDFSPDLLLMNFAPGATRYSDRFKTLIEDSAKISMPGAVGLSYTTDSGYAVNPILVTSPVNTWNKKGSFAMDTGKVTYNPENGDSRQPAPVALALTRKVTGKEQRIMVLGDADFMSNAELRRYDPQTSNFDLAVEMFRWFSYGEFPINSDRPKTLDNRMRVTKGGVSFVKMFFLWILPGVLLLWSMLLLIRRKRK